MIREQFHWRGNGTSLPGGGTQGYPQTAVNATWPATRGASVLQSSKNLLWLFGGVHNSTLYNDISAFIDGMIIR